MARPLVVSLGDPNGLGPELVARHFPPHPPERPVIIVGPAAALSAVARKLNLACTWTQLAPGADLADLAPGMYVLTPPELADFTPAIGQATPAGGRAAGASLDLATSLMLAGRGRALVTCPLNKAMLQDAGFDFPGHTEFLAARAGLPPDGVCMHLCGPSLKVSLVTTHPALKDVPRLVTFERVERCLVQTWEFLSRLGETDRAIAVCGLNPHAGEGGHIGREEIEVIAPAVAAARERGVKAEGPLPGDTVFHRAHQGEFAAVLAMYHDQGLAPLKLLHFGEAVNVTLGLPFTRTSPDHGTGFDLAGKGVARLASFRAAIDLALRLTRAESRA